MILGHRDNKGSALCQPVTILIFFLIFFVFLNWAELYFVDFALISKRFQTPGNVNRSCRRVPKPSKSHGNTGQSDTGLTFGLERLSLNNKGGGKLVMSLVCEGVIRVLLLLTTSFSVAAEALADWGRIVLR